MFKHIKNLEQLNKLRETIYNNSKRTQLLKKGYDEDQVQYFNPIIKSQEKIFDKISEQKPSQLTIVQAQAPQKITYDYDENEDNEDVYASADEADIIEEVVGPISSKYLTLAYTPGKKDIDTSFGLYTRNGIRYIGNKEAGVDNDDIIIAAKRYKGTKGLWELLTKKNVNMNLVTDNDLELYKEILQNSSAMFRNNDSSLNYPKENRSNKWKNIIKPIWDARKSVKLGSAIYLPCSEKDLTDKLILLLASWDAGNNGVRNEIVEILRQLYSKDLIDTHLYKEINNKLQIK